MGDIKDFQHVVFKDMPVIDTKRTYLITGGTGSLGTALTLELLSRGHKVRAFARNEHSHERLIAKVPESDRSRLSSFLGSVEDLPRLVLASAGATHIIHAAAVKVIPLAEYNPWETVQTNIIGTQNVARAAIESGTVKHAVFISTDKARAPSTHYGATKLCAERVWLGSNRYLGNRPGIFSACCYGNVFGSQGSVIHAWMEQAQFGVIRLTDPAMTRYHLTLHGAVALVLRTLHEALPGQLWIPKLPSYRLLDLARAFCTLAKLTREPVVLGRRIAEKRHEEMITETESSMVKEQDDTRYILTPGQVQEQGGWTYTSGNNPVFLPTYKLEEEIRAWQRSS